MQESRPRSGQRHPRARVMLSSLLAAARGVLSRRPSGLLTDVDGTISPIVNRPEKAAVHPQIADLLRCLADRLDLVAAVSGRPADQLLGLVGVDGMVYVGNHGLEWWQEGRARVVPEAQPYLPSIAATVQSLREGLDLPGVLVEDKTVTGTVHYRLSEDPASARATILHAIAQCPLARNLRVAEGRMVVNLFPPVRADKGTAVERLVQSRGLRGAIYLGDDLTDLDAFRALHSLRRSGVCHALLVAVASSEAPPDLIKEADYQLEGVESVATFLEQLVGCQDEL